MPVMIPVTLVYAEIPECAKVYQIDLEETDPMIETLKKCNGNYINAAATPDVEAAMDSLLSFLEDKVPVYDDSEATPQPVLSTHEGLLIVTGILL